eukprot:6327649-Prymnesium_polylepis.1
MAELRAVSIPCGLATALTSRRRPRLADHREGHRAREEHDCCLRICESHTRTQSCSYECVLRCFVIAARHLGHLSMDGRRSYRETPSAALLT